MITVGAYTRLSDAGLGCPDWPGCYGRLLVPELPVHVAAANEAYPERPLQQSLAWTEMAHRYLAAVLGLLILLVGAITWLSVQRWYDRLLSVLLVLLVLFQAVLGMWTVTLLLKPLIVTLHLLGGMMILSLLYWLLLMANSPPKALSDRIKPPGYGLIIVGLVVLTLQISLGGWTSSNYAALACPDFPTCQGVLWPKTDFKEAFILWRGLGIDYEGGVLDGAARTAIHITHRIGALITTIIILLLAVCALKSLVPAMQKTAVAMLALLFIQVALGISNVVMHLPLPVAVAHNGVAALLLLSLVRLLYQSMSIKTSIQGDLRARSLGN